VIPRHFLITTAILFALAIAMSIYVLNLRRREMVAPRPQPTAKTPHVAPPVTSGPMEKVTVYVAHDDAGELRAQSAFIPLSSGRQQRAEELLRALIAIYTAKNSPHALAPAADIRNVFLVDPGAAVIDVNSAFVDGQVSGVLPEELTIVSMVQTLATNTPGVTRVKILVDGKQRDTLAGHVDLTSFYDASQVSDLVRQLSAQ
jgi:hypothetical protein